MDDKKDFENVGWSRLPVNDVCGDGACDACGACDAF
jgi:hypothetical protein